MFVITGGRWGVYPGELITGINNAFWTALTVRKLLWDFHTEFVSVEDNFSLFWDLCTKSWGRIYKGFICYLLRELRGSSFLSNHKLTVICEMKQRNNETTPWTTKQYNHTVGSIKRVDCIKAQPSSAFWVFLGRFIDLWVLADWYRCLVRMRRRLPPFSSKSS